MSLKRQKKFPFFSFQVPARRFKFHIGPAGLISGGNRWGFNLFSQNRLVGPPDRDFPPRRGPNWVLSVAVAGKHWAPFSPPSPSWPLSPEESAAVREGFKKRYARINKTADLSWITMGLPRVWARGTLEERVADLDTALDRLREEAMVVLTDEDRPGNYRRLFKEREEWLATQGYKR